MKALVAALAALLGLGAHSCSPAAPPPPEQRTLVVGAVEDAAKFSADPAAKIALARDAGFGAVVFSAVWSPAASAETDAPALRRAADAAAAAGVRPVLAVYQFSSSTPLTEGDRARFVAYAVGLVERVPEVREVIVGNEPNANLFWLPQFDADGGDAAATAYLRLLAEAYDALKAADPRLTVVGGGLAPRGGDDPDAPRLTHSPTAFLRDLGAAYRASARTRPVMDAFSFHPYGEHSSIPPTLEHPRVTTIGLADYDKLVALLGEAFDGTAQRGSDLPIVYGEYGIETQIPPAHARVYTGTEPASVHPADEQTQGAWYADAIALAACQPTVRALYLFHVSDEPQLERLQTGVRYADDVPKASLPVVREAIRKHARCRNP